MNHNWRTFVRCLLRDSLELLKSASYLIVLPCIASFLMPCLHGNGPVRRDSSTETDNAFPDARASVKCSDCLTFNQPLHIWWNSPAAGCKPLLFLSFIDHILLLLPFPGPVYLFPLSHTTIAVKKASGT